MGAGELRRIGANQRHNEQGEAGEQRLPEGVGDERKAASIAILLAANRLPKATPPTITRVAGITNDCGFAVMGSERHLAGAVSWGRGRPT